MAPEGPGWDNRPYRPGPGWDSPYGRSLQQVISLDPVLASNIRTEGLLLGTDKWGALHQCEAFILPSHQENFGVSVAEALSCGRAVLLTRAVNIHESITLSASGLSCEPTFEGVYEMLMAWSSIGTEQRSGMSRAARKLWEEHFSIRTAAHRWMSQLTQS